MFAGTQKSAVLGRMFMLPWGEAHSPHSCLRGNGEHSVNAGAARGPLRCGRTRAVRELAGRTRDGSLSRTHPNTPKASLPWSLAINRTSKALPLPLQEEVQYSTFPSSVESPLHLEVGDGSGTCFSSPQVSFQLQIKETAGHDAPLNAAPSSDPSICCPTHPARTWALSRPHFAHP